MIILEKTISKYVPGASSEVEYIIPTSGSKVAVIKFVGSAAFSEFCVVKLVWKYNLSLENQKLLWTIKGANEMPFEMAIPSNEVDGVNSLALVCENEGAEAVYLSGFLKIEVYS